MTKTTSPTRRTRRGWSGLTRAAGLVAIMIAATACGGGQAAQTATPSVSVQAAYPRTVQSAAGSTVIPAAPQRVLALYASDDLDALVALGVKPVAVAEDGLTMTDIVPPWDGASADYQYVDMRPTPNLEQIAAYAPDLILINDGFYEEIGTKLSAIAPTVAYRTSEPWQDAMRLFGATLAKETEAEKLITETEGKLATTSAAVKACVGDRTISFVQEYDGSYYGIGSDLISGGFLTPYGFTFNKTFQDSEGQDLSEEKLDLLDADVILVAGDVAAVKSEAVFASLPAARAGKVFKVSDQQFSAGGPNVLRGPWAIDNLVPDLLAQFGC